MSCFGVVCRTGTLCRRTFCPRIRAVELSNVNIEQKMSDDRQLTQALL